MNSLSEWRKMSLSVLDDDLPCVLVGTKSDLGKANQIPPNCFFITINVRYNMRQLLDSDTEPKVLFFDKRLRLFVNLSNFDRIGSYN